VKTDTHDETEASGPASLSVLHDDALASLVKTQTTRQKSTNVKNWSVCGESLFETKVDSEPRNERARDESETDDQIEPERKKTA
jgi:hypothetical protein